MPADFADAPFADEPSFGEEDPDASLEEVEEVEDVVEVFGFERLSVA